METFLTFKHIIEFVIICFTLYFSFRTWLGSQIRSSKSKKIIKEHGEVVIALQVGRTVIEAVNREFPKIDKNIIDVKQILDKDTLLDESDYKKLAVAVHDKIKMYQYKHINLILSGPVALSCIIGQMIGLNHYSIDVYQLVGEDSTYFKLPQVDRSWL